MPALVWALAALAALALGGRGRSCRAPAHGTGAVAGQAWACRRDSV